MRSRKYDISDVPKPRNEVESIINEWIIGPNAERDRKIMIRCLLDGVCYEPLAEEFGLSVTHIKRILDKRFNRISNHL